LDSPGKAERSLDPIIAHGGVLLAVKLHHFRMDATQRRELVQLIWIKHLSPGRLALAGPV